MGEGEGRMDQSAFRHGQTGSAQAYRQPRVTPHGWPARTFRDRPAGRSIHARP